MSRFANPEAVDTLDLGPCQCGPKSGHDRDEWVHRTEIGAGERGSAAAYGFQITNQTYYDFVAMKRKLIEIATVSWNLVDDDGKPVVPSVWNIGLLDDAALTAMIDRINAVTGADKEDDEPEPLPKASGDPSPAGTPETPSPTRTTRKRT